MEISLSLGFCGSQIYGREMGAYIWKLIVKAKPFNGPISGNLAGEVSWPLRLPCLWSVVN